MTPQEHKELAAAVAELGALPMPVGSDPKPEPVRKSRTMLDHARDALRARMAKDDLRLVLENTVAYAAELERQRNAFRDQRNSVFATNEGLLGEVAESDQARLLAENETRAVRREADALRARVAELEAERKADHETWQHDLRTARSEREASAVRIAELLAERHSTNEALDDAVAALRARETASVDRSADKLTALFAPTQALREDPHDGPLHHDYRVGRDLPEWGGV